MVAKNWTEIVNGLPNEPINAIREDPYKKGLLFAGSEKAVYVSFDDGDHWQSLRLNMPATSIRDLVIKDDDIVVATHGRSFWILDDITPLRQVNLSSVSKPVILFKPQTAIRVRWNMGTDTPLPQEEPAGTNPPDGAVIDYYLKEKSSGEITLDIMDSAGALVRHFSSNDTLYTLPDVNIPTYWIRPQKLLSADAGSHRFLWDMRYQPLNVPASYSIGATFANTAPNPSSPWVMPGTYTLKLTVNNNAYVQTMRIKMESACKDFADLSETAIQSFVDCLQWLETIHEHYKSIGKDGKAIERIGNRRYRPIGNQNSRSRYCRTRYAERSAWK